MAYIFMAVHYPEPGRVADLYARMQPIPAKDGPHWAVEVEQEMTDVLDDLLDAAASHGRSRLTVDHMLSNHACARATRRSLAQLSGLESGEIEGSWVGPGDQHPWQEGAWLPRHDCRLG